MSERIRLSRAKGFRLPSTARNVARPTKWGTWHYHDGDERRQRILADVHTLRGYDLACWCPVGPCHADELLRRANS